MPAPCLRHAEIPRTDTRLYATRAAGRTPSGTGRLRGQPVRAACRSRCTATGKILSGRALAGPLHPAFMFQIPAHGTEHAFLQPHTRLPAKLVPHACGIHGITPVMAGARTDVIKAMLDMDAARELITTTRYGVDSARENYAMSQKRYMTNIGTITDLVDAQVRLTEAERDASRALADYHSARARFYFNIGQENPGLK